VVIAETSELPTKFAGIVVTDDQGRYVLPDRPRATDQVFIRGYGLIDSSQVRAKPGQHDGSMNKFAKYFPLAGPSARQVECTIRRRNRS
jgi:hypothetical protein